ncbi:MAG TPA: hypothetical protein V6D00_00650 [Pantanalinema sp.]
MRRSIPSKRPAPGAGRSSAKRPIWPIIGALAALPVFFVGGMVAGEIAKSMVSTRVVEMSSDSPLAASSADQIRLDLSNEARIAVLDPASIRMELARGWEHERVAFQDPTGLLYFSGPFFEERKGENDYYARAIGDLYFDDHLELATPASRGFADRRYYMALRRSGSIEFGYSGWRPGYEEKYVAFIGGLGYLYSPYDVAPDYSDPYTGLKQELHNMIPRERLLVGRDAEGHLVVMKTLPMPLTTASWLAKSKGLVEAYYLDQGNKARFIVPGRVEDTPRYNMPYMLRISDKASPPMLFSPPPPLDEYQLHHKKRKPRPKKTPVPSAVPSTAPTEAPAEAPPGVDEPVATPAMPGIDETTPAPNSIDEPALPQ